MDYHEGYERPRPALFLNGNGTTLSPDDDPESQAKERDALLWLANVAHGTIREDLKEPYYFDGQGGRCLKSDYILGLTSGEFYAAALGNIYRTPTIRNYTHDEILQFLSRKGIHVCYSNGNPVTETDLGFNRPIRMRAHLPLIDAIMLVTKKEMIIPNGVLKDSARLQAAQAVAAAGKKSTAFAPLPNTTSWLDYTSSPDPKRLSNGKSDSSELPENDFQPSQPQVLNLRLALQERQRRLQGEASKKGHEWMQQMAKAGDTAFIQTGTGTSHSISSTGSQQSSQEEHVYEEINENAHRDPSANEAAQHRRAKWAEQDDDFGGGGDNNNGHSPATINAYSTRQPPKPLPRRNITTAPDYAQVRKVAPLHNGSTLSANGIQNYDTVDDDTNGHELNRFLPDASGDGVRAGVRLKPKVIRNPTGSATVNLSNRLPLKSPTLQRDFVGSINVLNPAQDGPVRKGWNDEEDHGVENGSGSDQGATGFDTVDQCGESDMERKKQKLLENQLKRRAEQEASRQAKELENADRMERQRQAKIEKERKIEEEKARRDLVFQEYQRKKAAQAAEESGLSQPPVSMRENRSKGRARPLSVHANSVQTPTAPPVTGPMGTGKIKRSPSQGDVAKVSQDLSILSLHNPRFTASSARQGATTDRRQLSPPGYPSRAATTDNISDTGSSNSGQEPVYNGPKLFKKPSAKSNRLIIHNAIRDCCLPGIINEDVQRKVLEALAQHPGSHFLVLFRDANCQYRGLYCYDPDSNEAFKVTGTGPARIDDTMTEKLFKYNSGSKKFAVIPTTHHMSVQIDGITIQSALWYGKKTTGLKPPLEFF